MNTTLITGGCLCGAVRYRVSAAPLATRVCWCRLCQYLGGGSGTVNVAFLTSAMTVEGELADYACVADSGNRMHRRFCPTCGTPVFSAAEARPHLVFARAGTLDDPELARPEVTIWAAQAPQWACISETLPRIEGQPPPAG
jgi:hypothetical protein